MRRRTWSWDSAGRRLFIIVLLLGHLLWIILGRGASDRWRHLLSIVATPSKVASTKWKSWRAYRRQTAINLNQAQNEINQLKIQLTEILIEKEQQAPKLAEADDAIRLLGLKKLLPLDFRTARVIVNVRRAPFGGLIIDQGHNINLIRDQGIISPEGVVGRIWDVDETQSSILPLDAYNASTSVMLARSRATGVLQGLGPGKAAIRYINNQEVVQVGEPVFTSGLDQIFPRGLLVGYVSAVQSHDIELYVKVTLAANLDRVWLVLILPPHPKLELKPPPNPTKSSYLLEQLNND
jgi:rod shape-determining protein MreC